MRQADGNSDNDASSTCIPKSEEEDDDDKDIPWLDIEKSARRW